MLHIFPWPPGAEEAGTDGDVMGVLDISATGVFTARLHVTFTVTGFSPGRIFKIFNRFVLSIKWIESHLE